MKIAILINSLRGGGAERVASILANQFCQLGNAVTIYLFEQEDQAYEMNRQVRIVPVHINYGKRIRRIIERMRLLRSKINKDNPDIILAFTITNIPYALLAACQTRAKVIGLERANPQMHSRLLQLVIRYATPFCDGYVFQTEGAKNYYPKKIQKKAAVIKNPINIYPVPPIRNHQNTRFRICSVGRLHSDKDFETLIKAFSVCNQYMNDSCLDIFGEGSQRKELEQLVQDLHLEKAVHFKGFVRDIQSQICQYDLFAFSSKAEGMPNALMEAMALGLPCISTDCDFGPGELISSGRNGLLVPVGDTKKMAEAILWMRSHNKEREKMGQEAMRIADECSTSRIITEYLKYMEKVMKNETIR